MKQEITVISVRLTDFFDAVSRRHNDIILLPAHRTAHVQQLNCCVKKRLTFLRSICVLQTAQISVLWTARSGMSCSIVFTTDKFIVWIN